MNKFRNAPAATPPAGAYSHAVEVPPNARWLVLSGQVGTNRDGSIPPDIETQVVNIWQNFDAILADAGMSFADVIKMTVFLTRASDIPAYRAVRERLVGSHRPAATLLVVSGLARPEWFVEVEIIAAKA